MGERQEVPLVDLSGLGSQLKELDRKLVKDLETVPDKVGPIKRWVECAAWQQHSSRSIWQQLGGIAAVTVPANSLLCCCLCLWMCLAFACSRCACGAVCSVVSSIYARWIAGKLSRVKASIQSPDLLEPLLQSPFTDHASKRACNHHLMCCTVTCSGCNVPCHIVQLLNAAIETQSTADMGGLPYRPGVANKASRFPAWAEVQGGFLEPRMIGNMVGGNPPFNQWSPPDQPDPRFSLQRLG